MALPSEVVPPSVVREQSTLKKAMAEADRLVDMTLRMLVKGAYEAPEHEHAHMESDYDVFSSILKRKIDLTMHDLRDIRVGRMASYKRNIYEMAGAEFAKRNLDVDSCAVCLETEPSVPLARADCCKKVHICVECHANCLATARTSNAQMTCPVCRQRMGRSWQKMYIAGRKHVDELMKILGSEPGAKRPRTAEASDPAVPTDVEDFWTRLERDGIVT
jgi:hypothetical protein